MRAEVGDLGGDLGGEHHAAGLVLDGQAVTGLALERGRALPDHLVREAAQAGPERDVGRRPGRRDRGRDAACRVRLARHPGGELGAALPAKTRWACESTNPGSTARPRASTMSSAAGARPAGPVQAICPPSMTSAAPVR